MNIAMNQMLLIFALAWILVAALMGLIQGIKHTGHMELLNSLAEAGNLGDYHLEHSQFRRHTNTHTHSMLFALMTLTIALVLQVLNISEPEVLLVGSTLIAATMIWSLGALLNVKSIKGLGDLLLMAGLVLTLLQVAENP